MSIKRLNPIQRNNSGMFLEGSKKFKSSTYKGNTLYLTLLVFTRMMPMVSFDNTNLQDLVLYGRSALLFQILDKRLVY